ncbi:MAG TPA: cold shock domain-containing protein [Chloroflexota bacterium]|nr:cold shock domain-containing protein [Chloroflexota bacterium]
MHGRIASISPGRDSGFIIPDEEGGEIFFHRSALHGADFDELAPGIAVEFMLGQEAGARPSEGLRAVDVRLATTNIAARDEAATAE